MKTRLYSELATGPVPGVSGVTGKPVITAADGVGFTLYEIRPSPYQDIQLASPDPNTNHFYYCLLGTVEIKADSRSFSLEANSLLALPPSVGGALSTSSGESRVVVIHGPSSPGEPPAEIVHRSLGEIRGSVRDVDWTHGRSRRFLTRDDGFNLSIHNTICDAGHASPLWYKFNIEGVYFLRGDARYDWDDGKSSAGFKQTDVSGGDAWLVLMDKNDPHIITAIEESEALCIFYPALRGNETHDFTKPGFSVY